MKHKKLNIIGIIAVIIAIISAHCLTKEKTLTTGIKTENMDTNFHAGDDFYQYATNGWRAANPIPDDYSRYGAFEVLRNTNLERTRQIAESDNGKIGTLYQVAMDAEKLNSDGTTPVAGLISEIDNLTRNNLAEYLGRMMTFSSAFWGDGVGLDEMDSEHFLYNIGQGGIGISRDYYFDDDAKSVEIRKKYKEFITKQMKNFGIDVDVKNPENAKNANLGNEGYNITIDQNGINISAKDFAAVSKFILCSFPNIEP